MSDRILDRLELGARVAQSLVAENDLRPAARRAAITWRSQSAVRAAQGPAAPPAPMRPVARLAETASAFCCAA